MLRELMAITGLTAKELVHLSRCSFASLGGAAAKASGALAKSRAALVASGRWGRPIDHTASDIAEVVMGHDAWDAYKNQDPGSMKGPCRPHFRGPTEKRVAERKKALGGDLSKWSLLHEPEHFAGEDTLWTMDDTLTWLPPDGDVTGEHVETLGNMISEAFYAHLAAKKNKKSADAKKARKTSSTAAEALEWGGATSVQGNDFFKAKK